jgi:hypothetical protein
MKKLLFLLCLIPIASYAADYEGLVNPSTGAGYTLTLPLTHEDGGLEADVSSYSGILAISSGATYELNSLAELNTALGGIALVDTGTLTDTKYCTWDATGSEIDCATSESDPVYSSAPAAGVTAQDITDWSAAAGLAGSALQDVVNDITPQLGGTLDLNSNNVTGGNGEYVAVDQIRAYDASGLKLTDDGGDGIFVLDGGNVGIGTDSPAASLDIGGGSILTFGGGGNAKLLITDNVNNVSGVQMTNESESTLSDFRFLIKDTTDHYFTFSQPGVNNIATNLFGMQRKTTDFIFNKGGTARDIAIGTLDNNNLVLGTNDSRVMTITNDGKVSIGTETPSALFSLGNVSYTFAASGLSFGDGDTGHYESADDVLQTRIGGTDVSSWSSLGLDIDLPITYKQQSSDPAEPASGKCVTWASDGTGKGDAGDFLIACNVGGTTTWGTLFDASAGSAW